MSDFWLQKISEHIVDIASGMRAIDRAIQGISFMLIVLSLTIWFSALLISTSIKK